MMSPADAGEQGVLGRMEAYRAGRVSAGERMRMRLGGGEEPACHREPAGFVFPATTTQSVLPAPTRPASPDLLPDSRPGQADPVPPPAPMQTALLVPLRPAAGHRPKPARAPEAGGDIAAWARHEALRHGLDPLLVLAVIRAESNFNPGAVSSAGACGLMQLMPGTARETGVKDVFDPRQNIAGGTLYLARMLEQFGGDQRLALAAYNAGPGAVRKHGGVPPYRETREYIARVERHLAEYRAADPAPVPPGPIFPAASPAPVTPLRPVNRHFTVHIKNGPSRPAHVIVSDGDSYLIQHDTRTARIRKEHVLRITAPGA